MLDSKIIFTQSSTSEAFTKAKVTTFSAGVYDFLNTKPKQPHGQILKEYHKIFDMIIANANKVVNGKPECELYYAATGRYSQDVEIQAAADSGRQQIESLGLFSKVATQFLDADSLLRERQYPPIVATSLLKRPSDKKCKRAC